MQNHEPPVKSYSPFLPLLLLSAAIITLFAWNLMMTINQHSNGVRLSMQQDLQMAEANRTELKLRAIMTDLIELSKTDQDAEKIVKHYKIAINQDAAK